MGIHIKQQAIEYLKKWKEKHSEFICTLINISIAFIQIPLLLFFIVYNSINQDILTMYRMAEIFFIFELISIFIVILSNIRKEVDTNEI